MTRKTSTRVRQSNFRLHVNGELRTKTDTTTGAQTQYQYDALGNLLKVTLRAIPSSTTSSTALAAAWERRSTASSSSSGSTARFEACRRAGRHGHFAHAVRLWLSANVPDYMVEERDDLCILSDQLGSPRLVVNVNTGSLTQRIRYDDWGNVLEDTSPAFMPFGFAGGIYDPDTGLVRFGARD